MSDNFVRSFQLESSAIRGRVVRLGAVLDDILSRHNYPDDVAHLTGEVLTLCVLLSSMLKYEGIFTLQTQADGIVPMLVADVTSAGHIRACATYKTEEFEKAEWSQNRAELLGKGYMAFTVDQGEETDRYQGIVELKSTLLASVQNYFAQSEQINTGLMMEVGKIDGKWRACGIMVQEMPEDTHKYNQDIKVADEDDWRRTMILLGSVKQEELLDAALSAEDLLFRLFHEEGVRVFEPLALQHVCRCSKERIDTLLTTLSDDDIDHMVESGKITMTCEFCSRSYEFNPAEYKKGTTAS